jgi:hypothetical protein
MTSEELGTPDVSVDVQQVESRGFDGVDSAINVITIVASGALGGLTAAIGESVWSGVRGLVGRLKSKREGNIRTIVVLVSTSPQGELRYTCEVEDERDVDTFATSIAEVESTDRLPHPHKENLRYDIVDGEWRVV